MTEVIIGSRESKLAVLQSEIVKSYIEQKNREKNAGSEITVNILTMKTTGDIILDRTLDKVGGKGLFVKELDRALLDGKSNLSVHSLKDMPMEVPKELPLLAFSKREDPRDVLVLPEGVAELDPDKPLGCSSLRRTLQLEKLYPEMEVKSIRGNLQTRLRKLDEGEYSGLILAAAGLKRLGLESRISRYFTPDEMIPSAGQGILAVQGRKGEDYGYLDGYCDRDAWLAGTAERAYRIVLCMPKCHLKPGEDQETASIRYLYEIANVLPGFLEERGFTVESAYGVKKSTSPLLNEDVKMYYRDYICGTSGEGYQSLHITVYDNSSRSFMEVQLRTQKMDDTAEIGPANHLGYEKKQQDERARRDAIPEGECVYFDEAYERGMRLLQLELADLDVNMFSAVDNSMINDGCGLFRGRLILPYEHLSRFQNDVID